MRYWYMILNGRSCGPKIEVILGLFLVVRCCLSSTTFRKAALSIYLNFCLPRSVSLLLKSDTKNITLASRSRSFTTLFCWVCLVEKNGWVVRLVGKARGWGNGERVTNCSVAGPRWRLLNVTSTKSCCFAAQKTIRHFLLNNRKKIYIKNFTLF